ncbi:MAG: biotin--[acetyl-CoA-carboxylase] ligase [Betaproteobacteria bacterium]
MSSPVPVEPGPGDGAGLRLAWDAPGLAQRLAAWAGPVSVRAVARTGSTNTDLLDAVRRLPAHERTPQVLLAEQQTAGRGRMGRNWVAQAGASLTFSLAWPLRPQQGWGALSLAVGHALAQALQPWPQGQAPHGQGRLLLKWPNDLWWFDEPPALGADPAPPAPGAQEAGAGGWGRKVAGILIETVPLAAANSGLAAVAPPVGTRWVVVGVGVNVRAQDLAPDGLPAQGVAGTSQWRPYDGAPALWHLAAEAVARALVDFEAQGFGPIREAVQAREALIGQEVTLSAGPVAQGRCVGLDQDGALLVQASGRVHRVVAGEAQVRPASSGLAHTYAP